MGTDIKYGKWMLWFHITHATIVFVSVAVSSVFGPCFGLDNMDDYSIMYSNGGYTVIGEIYGILLMVYILTIVMFVTLHTIPYATMHWLERSRNRCVLTGKIDRGVILTLVTVILIPVYMFEIMPMLVAGRDVIDQTTWQIWLTVYVFIILSVYLFPYLFLHQSYPRLGQLPFYRIYKAIITFHLAIYSLILVYWLTPLPVLLQKYINAHYLYYWAR